MGASPTIVHLWGILLVDSIMKKEAWSIVMLPSSSTMLPRAFVLLLQIIVMTG